LTFHTPFYTLTSCPVFGVHFKDDWIRLLRFILKERTFEPLYFRLNRERVVAYLDELEVSGDPDDEYIRLCAENYDTNCSDIYQALLDFKSNQYSGCCWSQKNKQLFPAGKVTKFQQCPTLSASYRLIEPH